MSQQHIDLWTVTASAWGDRLAQVTDEQWEMATPCEGWTVRDLVDHAVEVQKGFAGGMVGAEIPEGADWATAQAAIQAAASDPSVLEGTAPGPAGEMPKTMMFGIATSDLLVHTWDLARAIGADETLPAEAVTACYMGLQKMPPQMMRAEGRFSEAVAPADGDDEQTAMLKFSGRAV